MGERTRLQARVERELADQLAAAAQKYQVTISVIIRWAVTDWLTQDAKRPPKGPTRR